MRFVPLLVVFCLLISPVVATPYTIQYIDQESLIVTDHKFELQDNKTITQDIPDSSSTNDSEPHQYPLNIQDHQVYFENMINKTVMRYDLRTGNLTTLVSVDDLPAITSRFISYAYSATGRIQSSYSRNISYKNWSRSLLASHMFNVTIDSYTGHTISYRYMLDDIVNTSLINRLEQYPDTIFSVSSMYYTFAGSHLWRDMRVSFHSPSADHFVDMHIWLDIDLKTGNISHSYYLSSDLSGSDIINCDVTGSFVHNDALHSFMIYDRQKFCIIHERENNLNSGDFYPQLETDPAIFYFNSTHFAQRTANRVILSSFTHGITLVASPPIDTQNIVAMVGDNMHFVLLSVNTVNKRYGTAIPPLFFLYIHDYWPVFLVILVLPVVLVTKKIRTKQSPS